MAPIKFEENIREKLEERSLEPSENAWLSLEQKLNADSKKRNKNKFWWFGVAACFIGLLFVTQQFITLDSTGTADSPVVVETENEIITNSVKSSSIIKESQQVVQEELKETSIKNKYDRVAVNKAVTKNEKEKQRLPLTVAVITETKEIPKILDTLIVTKDGTITSIENTIDSSEKEEIQITDLKTSESEMEELLATANKNIQTDNTTIKSVSVDANKLLEDVETEMPPSLRGQLFKVIEKNFKTATTAVTTRNE